MVVVEPIRLTYKEAKRRVIFQKSAQPDIVVAKQKNVIIQWEAPSIEIRKEFKDLGIVRANPVEYVQRFGASLKQAFELPEFVKEIRPPPGVVLASEWQPSLYDLEGDVQALSLIDLDREGLAEYRHIARQMESLGGKGPEYGFSYNVAPGSTQYGVAGFQPVQPAVGYNVASSSSYGRSDNHILF